MLMKASKSNITSIVQHQGYTAHSLLIVPKVTILEYFGFCWDSTFFTLKNVHMYF